MNELISQIAQKTGIGEDKARQAAETAISFLKTKLPAPMASQLDSALEGGGESAGGKGMGEKLKEGIGGAFGKKTA
jgi:hypothetical protein